MYTVYKQKRFGSLLRSSNETPRKEGKIQPEEVLMRRFTCYPAQWQWQMKIFRDPTKHVRILTRTGSLPRRESFGSEGMSVRNSDSSRNLFQHFVPLPSSKQLAPTHFGTLSFTPWDGSFKYQNGCDVEHPEAPQTDNLARNCTSIPLAHVISSPNMIKLTCSNKIPAYIAYSWCKTQTRIMGITRHLFCPKLFVKEQPFLMKHHKGCGPQKNLEKSIILRFTGNNFPSKTPVRNHSDQHFTSQPPTRNHHQVHRQSPNPSFHNPPTPGPGPRGGRRQQKHVDSGKYYDNPNCNKPTSNNEY